METKEFCGAPWPSKVVRCAPVSRPHAVDLRPCVQKIMELRGGKQAAVRVDRRIQRLVECGEGRETFRADKQFEDPLSAHLLWSVVGLEKRIFADACLRILVEAAEDVEKLRRVDFHHLARQIIAYGSDASFGLRIVCMISVVVFTGERKKS
jgi:hypothetical protein